MFYKKIERGKYKRIKPISAKGFTKELLILLAQGGGMIVLTALVGTHPKAILPITRFTRYGVKRFHELIKRLERQQYLVRQKRGREVLIKITDLGKQKAAWYQLRSLKNPYKYWDGIWRLLFFDVPIEANFRRHLLRREIRRYGFFPLQKSVFVFPHPCPEFIYLLNQATGLEQCVIFLETKTPGYWNDRLKKYFRLIEKD